VRHDSTQKQVADLRMVVISLEGELQSKESLLRDLRCETESLLNLSEQKQNQLTVCSNEMDTIRSNIEVLRLESERLCTQILKVKEELERIKQTQYQTDSAVEKVKAQMHCNQAAIQQFTVEESKLTESLSYL
jgi:chromosome segregation ATPase